MKIVKFKDEDTWKDFRRGRITGTKVKGLISIRKKTPKLGFYELIADNIAIPVDENMMMRGKTLEEMAIEEFNKKADKNFGNDLVIWHREEDDRIALSPDGTDEKNLKEAVEVKCLSHSRHLEALIQQKIPRDYHYQVLQYFIVNDELEKLYFVFFDPQITKDLFWIEVTREEVADEVKEIYEKQKEILKKVDEYKNQYTF